MTHLFPKTLTKRDVMRLSYDHTQGIEGLVQAIMVTCIQTAGHRAISLGEILGTSCLHRTGNTSRPRHW